MLDEMVLMMLSLLPMDTVPSQSMLALFQQRPTIDRHHALFTIIHLTLCTMFEHVNVAEETLIKHILRFQSEDTVGLAMRFLLPFFSRPRMWSTWRSSCTCCCT